MYDHVEAFVAGDLFACYHLLENEDVVASDGETEYLILFD